MTLNPPLEVGGRSWWWRLSVPAFAALLLFLYAGPVLRTLDPVAAVLDIGVLSLLLLAVIALLGFIALSHWLLGLLWPVFRQFHKNHFSPVFKSLFPWQKIIIFLSCFFLLLYAFVLVFMAVM